MTSRLVAVLLASRIGQDPLTALRYVHSKTMIHHHYLIHIYSTTTDNLAAPQTPQLLSLT